MEDRLKKFTLLVDAGSFTKASRELHVSQPALSVAVAKLERELHAPLLVHGARPLALTPAGQLAYSAGKDMLVRTGNLRNQLAELAQAKVTLAIGMIDSVASTLFASLENIEALEQNAAVSVVVDNSRNLVKAVEAGQLDMAFVAEQREYSSVLETVKQAAEPLVVVCHAALQRSVNAAVRAGRLPQFISYDQASTTHGLIADQLQQRGIQPETVFYSTSPEVMLHLVLLQKGVAVLPYLLVRDQLTDGQLALVGKPPLRMTRSIVAVKRRDTVAAAQLLHTADRLKALLAEASL